MPQERPSLVLEISRQDSRLEMGIIEAGELASTVRHYSHAQVSFSRVNKLCQEASAILSQPRGKAGESGLSELRKTGQVLWDELFSRPVKSRLKSIPAADLVLFLDESLMEIPWEILFDGEDFLCLKFSLGRLVKARDDAPGPTRYRGRTESLRMLVLANPTNDLKSAYTEGINIRNQFEKKKRVVSVDFKSTNVDSLYVKKNLRDYDIVHFAGHCEYDPKSPEDSGWVLSDSRFTARDIMNLSRDLSLPALVFSNACLSARVCRDASLGARKRAHSLATAFLFAGVRHYIGASWRIEDKAGMEFAREFYLRLMSGEPVGESVRQARFRLVKEHGLDTFAWANYLVYGDPAFSFFPRKPIPHKIPKKIAWKKLLLKFAGPLILGAATISAVFILNTLNPSAYFKLKEAKSFYRRGMNQEALALSSGIIAKNPGFLEAYPLASETARNAGQVNDALKYAFDYAFYSQKKGDKHSLIRAYLDIGWIYQLAGEYGKAYEFYTQARSLSAAIRDKLNEAVALRKLAVWYLDHEDADKALELLTKSSEANRSRMHSRDHLYALACDYFDIGLVFAEKNDFPTAREFYAKSRQIFERLNLQNELSDCYFNTGETYFYEKEYRKALDNYLQGLVVDKTHGNRANLPEDYNMIAELYTETGSFEDAERYLIWALAAAQEINNPSETAKSYYNLGVLFHKKGRNDKAREYLLLSRGQCRQMDSPLAKKVETLLAELP